MEYIAAWDLQLQVHTRVLAGDSPPTILAVEHPPVVTMGKRGGPDDVRVGRAELADRDVDCVITDRGGLATFHGPGQLVVYPILPLREFNIGPSSYVHLLEDVLIATLEEVGISAGRHSCAIGVFVEDRKIASIGVRVRKGVTLHGLALNISTDLSYFDLIVPCGLPDCSVTTLRDELGHDVERREVLDRLMNSMADALDRPWTVIPTGAAFEPREHRLERRS